MSTKLNLTWAVSALIRIIVAFTGLAFVVLSFFYGPDLNLLLVIGVMMIFVAGVPCATSNIKLKILGMVVSISAFILYAYMLTTLFKGSLPVKPPMLSDVTLVVPLLCLGYLFFRFLINRANRAN